MSAIYIVCFLALTVGIVLVLGLTPEQLTCDLAGLFQRRKSLREQSLNARGKKKSRRIAVAMQNIRTALEETGKGKQFSVALAASGLLFVVGCAVAIAIGNPFLIPVLAVAFAVIPFAYLRRTLDTYERHVKAELETALSIITTSYVRSDSIIDAVAENIDYLKPPVRGIFESFLAETTSITPDVQMAIVHLKEKISDTIFEEWCETLQSCQNDRTLKDTLMPVVAKFTDVRLVNSSLKTMLAEARREYYLMVLMVLCNIPLLYCLNRDWYNALMHTTLGKIVLAVCGTVILVTAFLMHRITKPVEYKR